MNESRLFEGALFTGRDCEKCGTHEEFDALRNAWNEYEKQQRETHLALVKHSQEVHTKRRSQSPELMQSIGRALSGIPGIIQVEPTQYGDVIAVFNLDGIKHVIKISETI